MSNSSEFKQNLNGFTGVFEGEFENANEVISLMGPDRPWDANDDWSPNPDDKSYIEKDGLFIFYARYEQHSYEGSAVVFAVRDARVFEVHGSHCSCYGLEGQWAEDESHSFEEFRILITGKKSSIAYGFSDKYDYAAREYVRDVDVWNTTLVAAFDSYLAALAQSASSTGVED